MDAAGNLRRKRKFHRGREFHEGVKHVGRGKAATDERTDRQTNRQNRRVKKEKVYSTISAIYIQCVMVGAAVQS